MDILVLIKQVPATESFIEIADDGLSIKTDGVKWVMNPYDEFAVEEAIRIKEKHGGTVTLICAGPDKAQEAIRTGMAMGADKGLLVNDPAVRDLDGLGTAKVVAAAARTLPYDLIIAGQRAVDDDGYIVGPAVAELLDIPHISMVVAATVADGTITCRRTVDGGTVTLKGPLPLLFTTQRGLNEPRYTSLPGIMKAKKKPLEKKSLADLGLEAPAAGSRVTALKRPPERSGGRIIEGESAQVQAAELVRALQEEAKVI